MSSLPKLLRGAIIGGWAVLVLSTHVSAQSNSGAGVPKVSTTQNPWEQRVLREGQPQQSAVAQSAPARQTPLRWSPVRPAKPGTQVKTQAQTPVKNQVQTPVKSQVQTQVKTVSNLSESVPAVRGGGPLPAQPEPIPRGAELGPLMQEMEPIPDVSELERLPNEWETLPGGPGFGQLQMDAPQMDIGSGMPGTYGTCGGGHGMCQEGCDLACPEHGHGSCDCWGGPECYFRRWWHCSGWWVRRLSFFGGVHGFKGPADQGRNGNFGFHEGVNWGAPLGGPFGLGYQLGLQAAHSNFSGDQTYYGVRGSDRDQIFFTGGLFRRAPCGGLQGGVVFDLLHDSYYGIADLKQIRTESALVFSGCREIGFWGAFGVGDDGFVYTFDGFFEQPMGPADTYSLFYRRHFSGGGQGRIWAGLSGEGDAVLGADCTVPLGTSWALENSFAYLIPKEGRGDGGQQDETWSVSIQLVWYPGRQARCVFSEPFHPLFSVADNGQFILDRP